MPWTAIENFNTYTNDATIDGGSGGSGWSDTWTVVSYFLGCDSPTLEGSICAKMLAQSVFTNSGTRTLTTTVAEGIFHCMARKDSTSKGVLTVDLYAGANVALDIVFNESGNIVAVDGAGSSTIQAYLADTNYHLYLMIDAANAVYMVKVGSGPWSSSLAYKTGSSGNISSVKFINTGNYSPAQVSYVDDIRFGDMDLANGMGFCI